MTFTVSQPVSICPFEGPPVESQYATADYFAITIRKHAGTSLLTGQISLMRTLARVGSESLSLSDTERGEFAKL